MEAPEQIILFKEVIEKYYLKEITESASKGKNYLEVKFSDIAKHNPDLANLLLDQPDEVIKAAELAIEQLAIDNVNGFTIRITGLPKTQTRNVWEIRSDDVGKFIALKGIINKESAVNHVCTSAKFECSGCGNVINILFYDGKYKEPTKCTCGRKGAFKVLSHEMTNTIKIELIDDLLEECNRERRVTREAIVVLSGSLTSHDIDTAIRLGKKAVINGYFEYQQRAGTVEFDIYFKTNSIDFIDVGWDTVRVNEKEARKIEELAKEKDIIERLAESIADIHGFKEVKQALLLLLAGAPHIYDANNNLSSRGTIHILLIGDPAGGKTFLMKRAGAISPIFYFESAATSSGRGLVASVLNDKEMGCWIVKPGAVALAHKGVVGLDEVDKTHEDDYGYHNNAMNDMVVHIRKAASAILDTETSYLATANPENRIFIPEILYYKQISMPKDFIDRFDEVFVMLPSAEAGEREKVMDTMLDRHISQKERTMWNPEFTHEQIRKYIAYCRRKNYHPTLSKKMFPLIKQKITDLMKPIGEEQRRISYRHIESALRFAYGAARIHLSDVTKREIEIAFSLKRKAFIDLGLIDTRGGFSWAKLEDIDEKQISDVEKLSSVIREVMPYEKDMGEIDEIVKKCQEKGMEREKAEVLLEKMKRAGDYFEPRRGFIMRIL